MKKEIWSVLMVFTAIIAGSCSNSSSKDELAGIYVAKYTFKPKNINTGLEIGETSFIDSVVLVTSKNGYELTNNVWGLNNFDEDGWSRRSENNRKKHVVTFDENSNTINSPYYPPIIVDTKNNILYLDKGKNRPYKKVN